MKKEESSIFVVRKTVLGPSLITPIPMQDQSTQPIKHSFSSFSSEQGPRQRTGFSPEVPSVPSKGQTPCRSVNHPRHPFHTGALDCVAGRKAGRVPVPSPPLLPAACSRILHYPTSGKEAQQVGFQPRRKCLRKRLIESQDGARGKSLLGGLRWLVDSNSPAPQPAGCSDVESEPWDCLLTLSQIS